jgi:hypothetical protein
VKGSRLSEEQIIAILEKRRPVTQRLVEPTPRRPSRHRRISGGHRPYAELDIRPGAYDSATIRPFTSSVHQRQRPASTWISTRPRDPEASIPASCEGCHRVHSKENRPSAHAQHDQVFALALACWPILPGKVAALIRIDRIKSGETTRCFILHSQSTSASLRYMARL